MKNLGLMIAVGILCCANGIGSDAKAAGSAKKSVTSKAGGTFTECRNCPVMVVIPAGTFTMGTPATEDHHRPIENQHKVTIAKPFAVSRTEVTWDQWEACARDGACDGMAVDKALRLKMDGTPNPDFVDWGRGTRPVVGVSWYDAQAYVGWLSRQG